MPFQVLKDVDLSLKNTLGVPSRAQYFASCQSLEDIREAIVWARENKQAISVLGGGSNVLLTSKLCGLVLQVNILGIEYSDPQSEKCSSDHTEKNTTVAVQVGAGEHWHDFVRWCVDRKFCGLENLAYIPGSVGAAPVQNIGAYGVEVAQYISSVDTIDLRSGKLKSYTNKECQFAYRDSVFKSKPDNCALIYRVNFCLSTKFQANLGYPILAQKFVHKPPQHAAELATAVEQIRRARLPDPSELPNAGSFFKNPVVSLDHYQTLRRQFPGVVAFDTNDHQKKLAAAWLIDYCGWKGRSINDICVHQSQALVICNPKGKSLDEVYTFANAIQTQVKEVFDVELEIEPQRLRQHLPII